ncbi:histidine kinase [Paenibacillus filicis]|uniref:Histidine kinase n=1 Tax=Paenibacillus filicis TaxID=669464 RepID=A0ABU9DF47_9BACL
MNTIQLTRKSFSRKLIASLAVIILFTFAVSGYISYKIHLNLFTEEISEQFSKTNEQAAARLDLQIRDIYRISNFIVFHPYVQQVLERSAQTDLRETYTQLSDQDELNKLLFQVKYDEPKLASMYLYDTKDNGFIFGSSNAYSTHLTKEAFLQIKDSLKGSFGNLIWFPLQLPNQNLDSGYQTFFVAARQMKTVQQNPYGIMVMLFDQTLISEYLIDLVKDAQANVFLYDKMDHPIYSDMANLDAAPPPGDVTNHNVGDVDGKPYLYAKSRSGVVDFTLISRVSLDSLQSRSGIIFQVNLLIGLVSLLLAGVLVTLASSRLLRPLRELVQGMTRMKQGNLQTRLAVRTDDELGIMARSFNSMAEHLDTLIKEVYERQLNEREAELTALQAQLNPHFLHNTLDTIYWMVYLKDDRETAKLVVSLSDMLRYALEPAETDTTLHHEFTQIRNYLTIQNQRFGHELETIVHLEEGIESAPVPRLILQPLVENVFVHAFTDMPTAQVLVIRAYRGTATNPDTDQAAPAIIVEIIDNGKGMDAEQIRSVLSHAYAPREKADLDEVTSATDNRKRKQIGIRNVIRRLNLLYREPYGLRIESKPGTGTKFRMYLPPGGKADDRQNLDC